MSSRRRAGAFTILMEFHAYLQLSEEAIRYFSKATGHLSDEVFQETVERLIKEKGRRIANLLATFLETADRVREDHAMLAQSERVAASHRVEDQGMSWRDFLTSRGLPPDTKLGEAQIK